MDGSEPQIFHPCSFHQPQPISATPRSRGRRNEVLSGMYDEWAETAEGKAWLEKKAEKKAKQKEIQAKIRLTLVEGELCVRLRFGFLRRFVGYV